SNIAALPNLKVLSLVSMGLGGPLPANIGDLHYLEILNISSNAFNGSIPLQISSLKSLQTLILDHNSFTGQIPEWISSLPELSVLSLRNNSFIGSIPTTLSAMGSLRTLVLSQNNLSGQLDGIKNLNNLQVVQLEDNSFGPQFPPALPHKLVSLVLRNNRFHSAVESGAFNSCFQLQNLDISMNDLVGVLPTSLLTLPSLTHLNIGGNKFTGKLLNNMSCTQLRLVNLTNNRLTGNLPDCLRNKSKVVL
ncbi:receptor-like kinase 17, partial [Genlisea aurea]